jgi:hypothetical protein
MSWARLLDRNRLARMHFKSNPGDGQDLSDKRIHGYFCGLQPAKITMALKYG